MSTASPKPADVTLDVSGQTDPGPILSISRSLGGLDEGSTLYLISDCGSTGDDLRAWTRRTRNALLQVDRLGESRFGFLIRKGEPWAVSKTVETLGARCPVPVVELSRAMATVDLGDVVKLVSDCTSAEADVESWVRVTGQELLGGTRAENGTWSFYVRKSRRGHA